jgi:hypothetical protein
LSIDLSSIVRFETRPDERVVIGESCGVIVLAEASEQFGRSFDVSEEESKRFRGKSVRERPDGCYRRASEAIEVAPLLADCPITTPVRIRSGIPDRRLVG